MNVLWFEVTTPQRYKDNGIVYGGWQDSLERIVRTCSDVELTISFMGDRNNTGRKKDGNVDYIPMNLNYSLKDKIWNKFTNIKEISCIVREMQKVVELVQPDLIQVFGTEWPFGRIARFTTIPVVVHIMGSLIPYMNAQYSPFFSYKDLCKAYDILKPKQFMDDFLSQTNEKKKTRQGFGLAI